MEQLFYVGTGIGSGDLAVVAAVVAVLLREGLFLGAGNHEEMNRLDRDLADGNAGAQSLDVKPDIVALGAALRKAGTGLLERKKKRHRVKHAGDAGREVAERGQMARAGLPGGVGRDLRSVKAYDVGTVAMNGSWAFQKGSNQIIEPVARVEDVVVGGDERAAPKGVTEPSTG